VTEIYV